MNAMKMLLPAAAMVAGLAVAASASATITVSNSAYETYAQDVATFSQTKVLCDFESPLLCIAGYNFAFAGGNAPGTGVFNGSQSGITAAPPGDGTDYASVLGPNGVATLTVTNPLSGISFFMGSPDQYNSITFYTAGHVLAGSFDGSSFTGPPANGDQSLGERISFNFNGAAVNEIQFTSTQNSFEFDRVGLAIPEPTTWALMILGFGGIGAMVRNRRRLALTA
jgi:hypothetical protein